MNQVERVFAVLQGEQLDVMPWFADLTYWYHARVEEGTLPERYMGDGILNLYRDYGCGAYIEVGYAPWKVEYGNEVTITQSFGLQKWHPNPRSWENWYEDEIKITNDSRASNERHQYQIEWNTPVGTITQVKEYLPQSFCWAYRKHPVKSRDDIKVLCFIKKHEKVYQDFLPQKEQIAFWSEMGVANSLAPRTPIADLFYQWMGVTNTVLALHYFPDEMEELMEIMDRSADSIYNIIAESPAPTIAIVDQIHSDIINPKIFSRYFAPSYQRHLPGLHDKGKKIMLHVDGNFRKVLPLIGEIDIDIAEALTVAPVGDVAISELRELAGPNLILWGGLPGALFSKHYPEDDLRDCVMQCLKHHKDYGRFVFGVADEVPPDGDLERVRMVTDMVEKYGRY